MFESPCVGLLLAQKSLSEGFVQAKFSPPIRTAMNINQKTIRTPSIEMPKESEMHKISRALALPMVRAPIITSRSEYG